MSASCAAGGSLVTEAVHGPSGRPIPSDPLRHVPVIEVMLERSVSFLGVKLSCLVKKSDRCLDTCVRRFVSGLHNSPGAGVI